MADWHTVMEWLAWIVQYNPDILAAHAHPLLAAATESAPLNGTGAVLAGLAGSRYLPERPTYSALGLAAGAKDPVQRIAAAETMAALADRNRVDPVLLSCELSSLLEGGNITASRVADTIRQAAEISPVTGLRMLQVLLGLLDQLHDIPTPHPWWKPCGD
ncbi:DUF6493 family protein [Corynebacterium mendelii]|uniref:Uncharacterized protein n=1 Tax=Corynebacterium mendelii TaxID=2765362 RepID=A0A939E3R0_9CORY|nr:DUF6493 family protein [Corynebacterium mendelii]MBN9644882.1 hypothetical protein [Corynebacterium mendelii]